LSDEHSRIPKANGALEMHQSKPATPLRKTWKAEDDEEPSPPGRYGRKPSRPEGLPGSSVPPVPALPVSPYPSGLPGSSLRTSTSRYSLARPAVASRFSSQRSSGLSKSQSMFSLPKASGSALSFPAAEGESSIDNLAVEAGGRQRVNGEYTCMRSSFYGSHTDRNLAHTFYSFDRCHEAKRHFRRRYSNHGTEDAEATNAKDCCGARIGGSAQAG
jgi:hypothetical protein